MNRRLSRVEIHLKAIARKDDTEAIGTIRNISLNGIFLEIDSNIFNIGDIISVEIQLLKDKAEYHINVGGNIIRKEDDGFAVQFTDIELDSFVFLKNLITYNKGDSEQVDIEFMNFVNWKFQGDTQPEK